MNPPTITTPDKQHIDASRDADQVVIHWGDREPDVVEMKRFVETMRSSTVKDAGETPLAQKVAAVFTRAASWVTANKSNLSGAWITERHGHILIIATGKDAYDEATHDSLIDLAIEIANDPNFQPVEVETLLLPPISAAGIDAFLSPHLCAKHTAFS